MAVDEAPFEMRGQWHEKFFNNDNPIVLNWAVAAENTPWGWHAFSPDKNFIGVDIKGARMWTALRNRSMRA